MSEDIYPPEADNGHPIVVRPSPSPTWPERHVVEVGGHVWATGDRQHCNNQAALICRLRMERT